MASSDAQLVIPTLRDDRVEARRIEYANDHLRTPRTVIERVRQLGPIELDPCAVRGSLVEARIEWYGPENELEDGLARSWAGHGLVYCFPPPRLIGRWAHKIASEARREAEIVALLACRTDAAWLHDYVFPTAAAVCYWRGRLRALGEPRKSVPPRAVVYWGPRANAFGKAFESVGSVALGADVERARSWRLVVPRPSPVGTWVKQQGMGSRAVRSFVARFGRELDLANVTARCPPATGTRQVVMMRYGALQTGQESLERGGELVVTILRERRLVSQQYGYSITWRQAIDRRRPRTEIEIRDS